MYLITWLDMGHISIGMSRSLASRSTSGCLVMEYPWPILVAFRRTASRMFMSDCDPCQSVSPAWKKNLRFGQVAFA